MVSPPLHVEGGQIQAGGAEQVISKLIFLYTKIVCVYFFSFFGKLIFLIHVFGEIVVHTGRRLHGGSLQQFVHALTK